MIRKALLMRIHAGCEEEYERRHNPIWPDLATTITAHGVHNYSIFRRGLTLFSYAEIEDEVRWNALADTEIVRTWWAHMAPLMESNPDNSPKVEELCEVFFQL